MARPVIPSPSVPVIDTATGLMTPVWFQFFAEMARPSPGWGAASGTLSRAAFDSGVISDATDKQVMAALVTDLRSRGILGN